MSTHSEEDVVKTSPDLWNASDSGYDGYFAFLSNGKYSSKHIVDTTTFEQGRAPESYGGYSANIGVARTLCGRELVGRMIPLDHDEKCESSLCGSCLSILESKEVDDGGK